MAKLALVLGCLVVSGCGTVQSLNSQKNHGRFKDGSHVEVARQIGEADHLRYQFSQQHLNADGIGFRLTQANRCPVRVDFKSRQKAYRVGDAAVSFTGDPDVDIGMGMALDVLAGAAIVGVSGMSAQYNPNASPESWRRSQSVVWGTTAAVLAVDIGAYVYSRKKRTKMRYWTENEVKDCSAPWPIAGSATVKVALADSPHGDGLVSGDDGKFQLPATSLGAALLDPRTEFTNYQALTYTVNIEQDSGPEQLRGTAEFEQTISGQSVKEHLAVWRCAALKTDTGKGLMAKWNLQRQQGLLQDLDAIECVNSGVVKKSICDRSAEESAQGASRPVRSFSETGIFVNVCGHQDVWSKVIGGDLAVLLKNEKLDDFRASVRSYGIFLGDKWVSDWNRKAEGLVAQMLSEKLTKKTFRTVEQASSFVAEQREYLTEKTAARLSATLGSAAGSAISRYLGEEDFRSARTMIRAARPGAGEKWAIGQEKLVAKAVVRKEQREAAAEKWCEDNRFKILEKTPDWKSCMSAAGRTDAMMVRLRGDKDLYELYLERSALKCVSQVGLSSMMSRFQRDCECSEIDDFTFEQDNDYWELYGEYSPCEILSEDQEEARWRAQRLAEADTAVADGEAMSERACLDLEYKLEDKSMSYRDCMSTAAQDGAMLTMYSRDSELYSHHMGLASKKCVSQLGMTSSLTRFEGGCECSDIDDLRFEDKDGEDHDPCEDISEAREEAEYWVDAKKDAADDPEERACVDLEKRVTGKMWDWRKCMSDNEWTPQMSRYMEVEDLYEEKVRRLTLSCLDRVGMRSNMKRLARKCGCTSDEDEYWYEDRAGNTFTPCDEFE